MGRPVDPRLLHSVPPLRRFLAVLAVSQLSSGLLIVAQVWLLTSLVAAVLDGTVSADSLAGRLALLVTVALMRAGLAGGLELLSARASLRIREVLRRKTLAATVDLGPAWALRQPAGRVITATGPGLDYLDGYVTRALPALVGAVVVPPVALIAITFTDLRSGVLLLVMLPLVPVFMALVGLTTRRRLQEQYAQLGRLSGRFLDLLRGLTTLRVYGQLDRQEQKLGEVTERYRTRTMAAIRVAFLSALALDLVATLSVAVVAVDLGLRLAGGGAALLTALVVLFLAPEVFAPLRSVGAQYHANEEGLVAAGAALDILDEAASVDSPSAAPLSSAGAVRQGSSGTLVIDSITVRYPDRGAPALDAVALTIRPGELVALCGSSGGGKSTLIAAVLAFAVPTTGTILVGRGSAVENLSTLDLRHWRSGIAWLPQRPVPSRPTVAAEVLLGDPEATPSMVSAACLDCQTLPPDTALGEDGRLVSAGQRRRIALARVLLRFRRVLADGDVPIVLLDEPSEDLDAETELVVVQLIGLLAGKATVLIATHSRELAAMAGRVVTLEQGRVVDDARPPSRRTALGGVERRLDDVLVAAVRAAPADPSLQGPRLRLRDLARTAQIRRGLLIAAGLAALAGLAGLGLTASSVWLIGRASEHPNLQALAIAVVGVRLFALLRALLRYLERLSTHDVALRLLTRLRVAFFSSIRPLSASVLATPGRGDLLRRYVGDVDGVQDAVVRGLIPVLGAVATAGGTVLLAAVLVPAAAGWLVLGLILGGVLAPLLARRATTSAAELSHLVGLRDGQVNSMIDALPELVAYGAADLAVEQVGALDQQIGRLSRRPDRLTAWATGCTAAAAAGSLAAMLWEGAAAVADGRLAPVNLGVLAVCSLIAFEAIGPVAGGVAAIGRARAGLGRIAAAMRLGVAAGAPVTPATLPRGPHGLTAMTISLAPAPGTPLLLRDAGLELRPGTRTAVVGPSGSGKSTLLAALLGLVRVESGTLVVTGSGPSVDLARVGADRLPLLVAGSLQGDHVFDSTLRDNLRVVRPDATDSDLDEVARHAGLSDVVGQLPEGWSTVVAADGSTLSGGQRQRLLLARALLADPEILVLDEPTAHLDEPTERAILDDLFDATSGRTVVISTHRHVGLDEVDALVRIEHLRLTADAPAAPLLEPIGATGRRS